MTTMYLPVPQIKPGSSVFVGQCITHKVAVIIFFTKKDSNKSVNVYKIVSKQKKIQTIHKIHYGPYFIGINPSASMN